MIKVQEYEMKFLVTKKEFCKLLKYTCDMYKTVDKFYKMQTNFYYDTNDLDLYYQDITLRVRQKDDLFSIQTKCHTGSGILISDEEEHMIDSLPITILYKNESMNLQGQLQTWRFSIQISDGIKIDFDRNYYLGVQDFEIEIEYFKEHEAEAKKLASQLGLNKLNCFGKSSRFFNMRERLCRNIEI